jgi:drug/metabolite transporter (DMT)-like permease
VSDHPARAFKTHPQALICLHLAVLLFGGAGVIGKILVSPPVVTACVRSLLASLVLFALLASRSRRNDPENGSDHHRQHEGNAQGKRSDGQCSRPRGFPASTGRGLCVRVSRAFRGLYPHFQDQPRAHGFLLVAAGPLLAAHWWCFFEAVQRGSVGLALLSFATYPAFVCLLGWWWLGERLSRTTTVACIAVVSGLALLAPNSPLSLRLLMPLGFGVISGLTFALLTLANRKLAKTLPPLVIVSVQTGVAGLVLLPAAVQGIGAAPRRDWLWLALLGVVCTALAHLGFTASLTRLRAATVGITTALEPVYGIMLAWLLLGERPGPGMIMGGLLILSGAFLAGFQPMCRASLPVPANCRR